MGELLTNRIINLVTNVYRSALGLKSNDTIDEIYVINPAPAQIVLVKIVNILSRLAPIEEDVRNRIRLCTQNH